MSKHKGSIIKTREYHSLIQKLRSFFLEKNFYEVPVQSRLSILAACEDPFTIASFLWNDTRWPLPQTGQMWLEVELLENPDLKGVFCISTSYRDEPTILLGRHETIFPMFEFEAKGEVEDLKKIEKELLQYLGFNEFFEITYQKACEIYNTDVLHYQHEDMLCKQFTPAVFIEKFPERSAPFWNMKHFENGIFNKVDVLLHGQETIGSAERSTDKEEMQYFFNTVSEGKYREKLFDIFGRDRVERELKEFLSLDFFPRYGGGIGITRMIRALKINENFICSVK